MQDNSANIARILRYHQQTKHRFEAYAKGPETLDWSMQPDPFRNYQGCKRIPLPFSAPDHGVEYCDLYVPGKIKTGELNLDSVGALLELSMGLSAWKEYQGSRWALRCNPSSGNLHPTETYIIATGIDNLANGVYHYDSYQHEMEQRCTFFDDGSTDIKPAISRCLLIGLSSVFWREAWKYGERAYRYCQLDTGHAVAAIRYACAVLGWTAQVLPDIDDDAVARLLGLNRSQDFHSAETEHPDVLLQINHEPSHPETISIESLLTLSQTGEWYGQANILDRRHLYTWPIIDDVAQATRTDKGAVTQQWSPVATPPPLPCPTSLQANEIIQRRRSAQMFDGVTTMEHSEFFRILDMLVPRANTPPWDALPWNPRMHLVIFVHRVNGLQPGLYAMLRNDTVLDSLKESLVDKMEWLSVDNAPAHLQLFRLVKAKAQKAAATLSCHQRIASDSTFSLGMLSEFDETLENGPWTYKQLYWEAGMLGQVLYLEAEALNLQGTGIGCFFDDPVHDMLGIKDTRYQSLYHFTVGGALNDSRLRTLMPYAHLSRD